MKSKRPALKAGSNRAVFWVVVGLAAAIILCTMTGQSVGWTRLCGGGIALLGGFFLLLAEDKKWPLLMLLIGAALFFAEALLNLFASAG